MPKSFIHMQYHGLLSAVGIFIAWLSSGLTAGSSEEPVPPLPEIRLTSIDANTDVRLQATGANGEYVMEVSTDLKEWEQLRIYGSNGEIRQFNAPFDPEEPRFYRLSYWLASDGFHVEGSFAQLLAAGIIGADSNTWTALGFNFDPSQLEMPTADELPTASRNARVLAAVVGSLSILSQELRDTLQPTPTNAEVVNALLADLASGKLDGLGTDGQAVLVGESPSPAAPIGAKTISNSNPPRVLPQLVTQDLLDRINALRSNLPGLDDIVFTVSVDGTLSVAVPANWDAFLWDTADWQ